MEQKKRLGLGGRGWLLLIYQFIAFMAYTVFTNYPLNILSQQYNPMVDAQTANQQVSLLYTVGAIVGIVVQLILSQFVGRMKSVKNFGLALGAIAIALAFCVSLIPMNIGGEPNIIWAICYFLINVFITMWCTFAIGILVGQWFPTRKGTVMGIATISFPLANALIGTFAGSVMGKFGGAMGAAMADPLGVIMSNADPSAHAGKFVINMAGDPMLNIEASMMTVFWGFLPFLIITVIAWLIGAIAIKDYPEQCGAYRDNDRTLTPEIATQMMLAEIENKKNSSWKIGRVFTSRDYWFVTIPMGALLMFSVGMMTQTQNILAAHNIVDVTGGAFNMEESGFTITMIIIACFGAVGSFILGLLDTKFGTKKSIIIAVFVMIAAGILGVLSGWSMNGTLLMAALFCLGVFMGASSNYTVSAAAQYWRREDFGNVFGAISPVANVLAQMGPIVIALLAGIAATDAGVVSGTGIMCVFGVTLVAGVISLICILAFSPKHVKVVDDKYRTKDGKPLDDALVGRK